MESLRRWPEVRDLVLAGTLTRAEGARRLRVRYSDSVEALRNGGPLSDPPGEIAEAG